MASSYRAAFKLNLLSLYSNIQAAGGYAELFYTADRHVSGLLASPARRRGRRGIAVLGVADDAAKRGVLKGRQAKNNADGYASPAGAFARRDAGHGWITRPRRTGGRTAWNREN
jgi:hypothetical protein